ncbi:MAG: transporter substrate-binding domain-containing protein [Kangiellaceae bacterium]|nr:transporter substrate-binding domain-containing protein [Kangiellaceae bacterium]
MVHEEEASLPRSGTSSLYHLNLFEQFAKQHQLEIQWTSAKSLKQMMELLEDGNIDVIPRHFTITPSRSNLFGFTTPLLIGKEYLVANQNRKVNENEFEKLKLVLPESSAYVDTVDRKYPSWQVKYLSTNTNAEAVADKLVESSEYFSILDEVSIDALLEYREDIKKIKIVNDSRHYAWATQKQAKQLLLKLNEFIKAHHFALSSSEHREFDLAEMKKRSLPLRMITRNSPETYFMWKGELVGFEYELMQKFAKQHGLVLEVVVAETYQQMIQLLEQGKGDVIAAGLSRTEKRKKELTFSIRYNRVNELIVANKRQAPIKSLEDLEGRTIVIRKSSAFWETAKELKQKAEFELVAADENLSTELLIGKVDNGEVDLTISDSNLFSIEESFRDNIYTPLTLKKDIPYAYITRKKNPKLLSALNGFIKKQYRTTYYNVVKNKYFANQKRKLRHREERVTQGSSLSQFDALVKLKSAEYDFDWRLITSQMYQESRFNPLAKSNAGAQGLMQLLPRTAKELGYHDLTDPTTSISAGVEYLNWTRDRFSKSIALEERIYFALAAYNAGIGHVRDAQRLAKKLNLRSDKWFNHVEKAMLLLQKPEYYKKARFGYCRGTEPVNYVREIQQRYLAYISIIN